MNRITDQFLIELTYEENNTTHIEVHTWTLEELLREINRDTYCTDSNGDVCIDEDGPNPRWVMAGSPEDTIDHDKLDCYRPYTVDDWIDGGLGRLDRWFSWTMGEEGYRIIKLNKGENRND